MKLNEMPLNELRELDVAPKGYQAFLAKYRKLARERSISHLYVHFSNYRESGMDKSMVDSPDHSDPMGLYTYPLSYVIKHPSDVWYGKNARYLHIVKNKAKNPLYFREIETYRQADRILYRMGLSYSEKEFNAIRREHGWTGKWRFAKTMMSAMQLDYSKPRPEEKKKFTIRPASEQTKMLRKAGYDAMQDTGTGAIHEREPEQMVFLTRGSFEITETIQLREYRGIKKGEKNGDKVYSASRRHGSFVAVDHDDNEVLVRKIAALVAQAVDDKLTSGVPETTNMGGLKNFWTRDGKRISMMFNDKTLQRRMDTLKLGQKPHKWFKSHDGYVVNIEVFTGKGKLTYQIAQDEKFKDAMNNIADSWKSMQGNPDDPNWSPETFALFKEKLDKQRELFNFNRIRKENFLKPVSMEEMDKMKTASMTPTGKYYFNKVNDMRSEAGLKPWRRDQWQKYVDGKIEDPLYPGMVGPSEHSMKRLDRALDKRSKISDKDEMRSYLYNRVDFHPEVAIRSMARLNGFRLKNNLPPISKEQYAKYLRNPNGWRWDAYTPDMNVKESRLVEKFMAPLPDDWTEGLWVNPVLDKYSLTRDMSHVTAVAVNPVKFGLPENGKGTPFEKYSTRIQKAIRTNPMGYREIKDEMNGDEELKRFMTKQGWTRIWGNEGSLEIEAHSLKQVQATLLWLSNHGVEVWGIGSLDTWGDKKHLTNLDDEQVETLMKKGRLGTRIRENWDNVRSARSSDQRVPLPFDELFNKAFRITAASGDPSRPGYSIITPFNRREWSTWPDSPVGAQSARDRFNDPSFLTDAKWNQIYDAATRMGLIDRDGNPLNESDDDHQDALDRTGFWGKQGAGALIFAKSTGRFLIPLRSPDVEQPNTWGVWGGAIDDGENPAEAAKREVMEECGCSSVSKMIPLYVFNDKKTGFRYSNFVAIVEDEFVPHLDWETSGSRWCKFGQWPTPMHFGLQALLNDAKSINVLRALAEGSQNEAT